MAISWAVAQLALARPAIAAETTLGGVARMQLEGLAGRDETAGSASGGLSVRGLVGQSWLAYYGGLDQAFGAGLGGGFLYRAQLLPVGAATRVGRVLLVGSGAGVGISGLTSRLPLAVSLPWELLVTVDLGLGLELGTRAEVTWLAHGRERREDANTLPFGDEQRLEAWLRIGEADESSTWDWGAGYLLGIVYVEQVDARMLGGMVGLSLDGFAKF